MIRIVSLLILTFFLFGLTFAVFAQDKEPVEAAVELPVSGPWAVLAAISGSIGVVISMLHSWLNHPKLPGTVSPETKELLTTITAFGLSLVLIWYAGPAAAVWLGTPLESVPLLGLLLAAGASAAGSEGIQWLYQKSRQIPPQERNL